MGVETKVEGLTKSFGKQLIWGDVSLTIPEGQISGRIPANVATR